MRPSRWLLVVSLLASPALADDVAWTGPVESVVGPTQDEVRAFDAAVERFQARVRELEASAASLLTDQRARELAKVNGVYDERLAEINRREASDRAGAIASFEAFLTRWPDAVGPSSEVRLRLAELYFRQSGDTWLGATKAYEEALTAAGDDLDALEQLESQGEPKLQLSAVAALLQRIVDDNLKLPPADRYELLDVTYYMLAFCYAEQTSNLFDRAHARDVFRQLVVARPDSDYADAAHLMLGNYAFEDYDYAGSIPEFEAVLKGGPERRNYEAALYQLAWARYKLDDFDTAMASFVDLLDRSERRRRDSGRTSAFAPDAVTYLALSLADVAGRNDRSALEEATAFFNRIGNDKPYRWDVLRALADSLVRYSREPEAIAIYEALQTDPQFRDRPENPFFQDTVVTLLSKYFGADLARAGAARLAMTERYGEGSRWWLANRANPEALQGARKYTEDYLIEVARELKVRAQEAEERGDPNAPAAFSAAADRYGEYLRRFPISDGYFENQFLLADSLYRAGRYEDAATEYGLLWRDARFHEYGDLSLYLLFRASQYVMEAKSGAASARSPSAEVERKYTSNAGVEVTVYELTPEQAAFVEASDEVLLHDFGAPTLEGVDPRAIVQGNRAKIMYLPAQVLYYANRFDEARPRLQKIIKEFPSSDEAAYAANLYLNTYITEGDNTEIRRWSREFAGMRLGSQAVAAEREAQFQTQYERASYQIGLDAAQRGDHRAAANAFLTFVDEFPKSPNVADAILSAAASYEKMGRAVDAVGLYERFLREFPTHPDAKPFYFTLASNYESIFELQRAIGYYGEFLKRFPTDKDAPTAQYMVAFLKEGTGDHLGAAQGYEAYANKFPDTPDREDVHFRAGRGYEQVDANKAITFYRAYLKQYGTQNPDHAIAAQARIADLERKQGRTREADAAAAAVVSMFDRVVAAGGKVGPAGRDAAAAAAFPALKAQYQRIADTRLTGDDKKDADLLFKKFPADIASFDAAATAFVQRFLSFDHTIAALYLQGMARRSYARLGFSLKPPERLGEIEAEAYWELLEEQVFPQFEVVEGAAATFLLQAIDVARQQKRHSTWVDEAVEALHDLDPQKYPGQKEPLLGTVDARGSVDLPPLPWPTPPAAPSGGKP